MTEEVRTVELDGLTYVLMETQEQADEMVTDEQIQDCLEGWFGDRRTVPEEEFIDRLVKDYGSAKWDGSEPGFEIEEYVNPAARRLLSRARKIKKELND